jgi:hypothetical protein
MRKVIYICLLFHLSLCGQDKLYLRNGSIKKVFIMTIAKDMVYFKTSDTGEVKKIKREELLAIEELNGNRHIYGKAPAKISALQDAEEKIKYKKHNLGLEPFGILTGRATLSYEHISEDGKLGFVLPVSLTFDPLGVFYASRLDTTNTIKRIKGVNFIIGAEMNYYPGKIRATRFFIGPRLRYGTDVFMRNIKGFTLQTQVGWRFGKPDGLFSQHLSAGFGFVRLLDTPAGRLISPKQCYGWYSINYRVGINW